MKFKVEVEGQFLLILSSEEGHEFRITLIEASSGRGFDVVPEWNGETPSNSLEFIQAARVFARAHTGWA